MHANAFDMLTSLSLFVKRSSSREISNYILLMTLSICCVFSHRKQHELVLSNVKKNARKGIIIYSLLYLSDGQQFFFFSLLLFLSVI